MRRSIPFTFTREPWGLSFLYGEDVNLGRDDCIEVEYEGDTPVAVWYIPAPRNFVERMMRVVPNILRDVRDLWRNR